MLLDFGIISRIRTRKGGFKKSGLQYLLIITGSENKRRYLDNIGFISIRKNSARPIPQNVLQKCGIDGIFYDKITSIKNSESMTVDISVPDSNTYIANGFVSHNTLMHGGRCIVISTPNGQGSWYHEQCELAMKNDGEFKLQKIEWYNMDWVIEYIDDVTKKQTRIAPCDGLRKCETKEDIERYGEFVSPWLIGEYNRLKRKGEAHKFKQELLCSFIGSGSTVLSTAQLIRCRKMVEQYEPNIVKEQVVHVNYATGDRSYIDLHPKEGSDGFYVWDQPIAGDGKKIQKHSYVLGVDTATGENNDYSVVQVFDIGTREQVAEYMGHVTVTEFAKVVDWIGRWYNEALVNVERTGIGAVTIQELTALGYSNLWRERGKTMIGFATTGPSKPALNKVLIESIPEDNNDDGYTIKSKRLMQQLEIYIRKQNASGMDTSKTGAIKGRMNYDDLVLGVSLALIAAPDAIDSDPISMIPATQTVELVGLSREAKNAIQKQLADTAGPMGIVPMGFGGQDDVAISQEEQLNEFAYSLISGITPSVNPISYKKYDLLKRFNGFK